MQFLFLIGVTAVPVHQRQNSLVRDHNVDLNDIHCGATESLKHSTEYVKLLGELEKHDGYGFKDFAKDYGLEFTSDQYAHLRSCYGNPARLVIGTQNSDDPILTRLYSNNDEKFRLYLCVKHNDKYVSRVSRYQYLSQDKSKSKPKFFGLLSRSDEEGADKIYEINRLQCPYTLPRFLFGYTKPMEKLAVGDTLEARLTKLVTDLKYEKPAMERLDVGDIKARKAELEKTDLKYEKPAMERLDVGDIKARKAKLEKAQLESKGYEKPSMEKLDVGVASRVNMWKQRNFRGHA